jgi:hypothetical protein
MIRLIGGLVLVMGATGGVEASTTCQGLLASMAVACCGLMIMYSGAIDLSNSK